jgi:hypothetical protein
MSPVAPLQRIPVGVVVERRKAMSAWADVIWRPVAVLAGLPDARPWTQLTEEGESATFYAGAADIELYRSETSNYRRNLASETPSIWVVLQATATEPPYEITTVTADPAEGEGLTEPGQAIVEAVPMPELLRSAISAFVAEYPVDQVFEKRVRDRADPEAMARHGQRLRNDNER